MRVKEAYRRAIAWIADNDEPLETDVNVVADQISVLLVADTFQVSVKVVAADVLRVRHYNAQG